MQPAVGRVPHLPGDCEVRSWWSAEADSTQRGFVAPAEFAHALATFDVDLYATVYLEEEGNHETSG